jgi:hypothetical protein
MSRREKILIFFWVVVMVGCLLDISLPVHSLNQCCSANECAIYHHHGKSADHVFTDAQLQAWYESFNEIYFFSQLPKNVEVKWGDLTAKDYMGLTTRRLDGSILITIDRAMNPARRTAAATVAHETCHVAVPLGTEFEDHGEKFQACMVNLAVHGAFTDIW